MTNLEVRWQESLNFQNTINRLNELYSEEDTHLSLYPKNDSEEGKIVLIGERDKIIKALNLFNSYKEPHQNCQIFDA